MKGFEGREVFKTNINVRQTDSFMNEITIMRSRIATDWVEFGQMPYPHPELEHSPHTQLLSIQHVVRHKRMLVM